MKAPIKERPILFSAPMVRALLDGSKTQTRRVVKHDPGPYCNPVVGPYNPVEIDNGGYEAPGPEIYGASDEVHGRKCPYGQPGDLLWVRETCAAEELRSGQDGVRYAADDAFVPIESNQSAADKWLTMHSYNGKPDCLIGRKVPSIHMPRWASRIVLEIVSVRVERLNDISEDDCWAEGIDACDGLLDDLAIFDCAKRMDCCFEDAAPTYAALWESINGAGSWSVNPWVWVIEFKRVAP